VHRDASPFTLCGVTRGSASTNTPTSTTTVHAKPRTIQRSESACGCCNTNNTHRHQNWCTATDFVFCKHRVDKRVPISAVSTVYLAGWLPACLPACVRTYQLEKGFQLSLCCPSKKRAT
ncbi:unnamed protein product, partial [Ectocarpus sp. 12 AP-2014]